MNELSFGEKISKFIDDCAVLRREYLMTANGVAMDIEKLDRCPAAQLKDWERLALAQAAEIAAINTVLCGERTTFARHAEKQTAEIVALKKLICRMDTKCPICGNASTDPFAGGTKLFTSCRACGAVCERSAP